ncbi:MAG TPA: hypothetical protein VL528_09340 [Oxalicibacterium sp.]|nr:hypothetical protein [Oxalicibacterium sp.]
MNNPSHYESYRGWDVSVQVSGHLSRIDPERELPDYVPRVIVTEHKGRNFQDREVVDGHSYPTMDACIAHGIQSARDYIDCHMTRRASASMSGSLRRT